MNNELKFSLLLFSLLLSACASTKGTIEDRQQAVQDMKTDVLSELYEERPYIEDQIDEAIGYAVFSNANLKLILASVGGGYGVIRDNRSSQDTYMKMGEIGVGLGIGVKDFRIVIVFHTEDALMRFLDDDGIAFGAQADAAAVTENQGAAFGGEVSAENITIYQITRAGLALQATVKGTRFWQDDELN